MIPAEPQQTTVGPTVEQSSAHLDDLHSRIARRFRRPEVRERIRRYLAGLLGEVRRKNGWQMAETIGETRPRATQRILDGTRWDADTVRDDLREYVVEHLGDEEGGVLIVDETGFLKMGENCRRRSLGRTARLTVGTASGSKRDSGLG